MDQQGLSTAEYENQTVLQYFKYLSVSMEGEWLFSNLEDQNKHNKIAFTTALSNKCNRI